MRLGLKVKFSQMVTGEAQLDLEARQKVQQLLACKML
jgi:hypothetical protein